FPSTLALAWLLTAILTRPFSASGLTVPPGSLTAALSSNNLILSFPTTTTNYYGLQTSPDLVQPWTNLQAGLQGYGLVRTVTLSNAFQAGQGFYRTVLQPRPTQLLLPQSTAFAILGYDCGGISEQVYATGFDPVTGYPTGNVFLRTSCSTGKAGSPPSVHTASVAVTWDFAGNVISANTPATGAPASPTFIATDGFNDILYNAGANAYLIVPVPAAPAGVTAVQSGDQFQVAWMPNGVNPVAITSSTLTATPVNNSTASNLTTTVTGPATNGVIPTLQPATTYQITVVSTTIGGSSPASTPTNVTTEAASVAPSAPTNVVASWSNLDPTGTNDTLVVTWSAAVPGDSPVDQYQITITGSDGAGTFTQAVDGTTLTTYFTVDFVPNWTATVQAHNAAGWGPSSTPVTLGGL
ncbi:MAG TPA: fibronectin type III domain-containing protein, partial [Verrucomicrobiae bacterium]|nr:fibronectin type III domain-containing protein [Verrucomicrobiae bacterium]